MGALRVCERSAYRAALASVLALGLVIAQPSSAADQSACNGELAQMHGDRAEIAARADTVATALDRFETCARQVPDASGIGKLCTSQEANYRDAVAALNMAVDRVDARIRRIGISCVKDSDGRAVEPPPPKEAPQPPARAALQPPEGVNSSCDLARSYKGKIPFDGVVRICERSMSAADCRACLGPEAN